MRSDDGRVVSNFICQALSGEPLTIYGSGEQTRSFCYVADTVRGLMLLMESAVCDQQAVNIGNPHELTIAELVERIEELLNCPVRLETHPLPIDDPCRRRPDIGRARRLLGWEPVTPLAQGLHDTIEWFWQVLGERVRWPAAPAGSIAWSPIAEDHEQAV
jgi:UDP-glucuronate decarboxylase